MPAWGPQPQLQTWQIFLVAAIAFVLVYVFADHPNAFPLPF